MTAANLLYCKSAQKCVKVRKSVQNYAYFEVLRKHANS